jgi:hypothetical protein
MTTDASAGALPEGASVSEFSGCARSIIHGFQTGCNVDRVPSRTGPTSVGPSPFLVRTDGPKASENVGPENPTKKGEFPGDWGGVAPQSPPIPRGLGVGLVRSDRPKGSIMDRRTSRTGFKLRLGTLNVDPSPVRKCRYLATLFFCTPGKLGLTLPAKSA